MEQHQQQHLCDDIFYEAMRWMDAETLSVSACVSTSFRGASSDEKMWETLCSRKWPSISTDHNFVRKIITDLGGYKKFYAECARLIDPCTISEPGRGRVVQPVHHSNFASLVDVHFRGKHLFSKFVSGIPGAGEFSKWFSSCPFRLDVVVQDWCEEEHPVNEKSNQNNNSIKDGKTWRDIWEGMKLSWILIDRENNRVANLSSWSPISGQRHWPADNHFVLSFGSIVQSTSNSSGPVECSIILKCRSVNESSVELMELSLQVKRLGGGEHLSGADALPVLSGAIAAAKCRDEERVMRWYRKLLQDQVESKNDAQLHEWLMDFCFMVVVVIVGLMVLLARLLT